MNKQIRQRTWKYFWEQKLTEIGVTLGIIVGVTFVPYWLGRLFFHIIKKPQDFFMADWFVGIILLLVLMLLTVGIFQWIDCNWEKAKKKAKKDFK